MTDIRRINLQLFADDGSDAGGDGGPKYAGTPGGQQGGDGGGSQGDKPFAVFPDEKSFMSRVDREARKRLDARAKELGFESIEAMESALKAARERADAEKTELEKAREAAAKAEEERKRALDAANQRLIRAEVKVVATELGIVDPDAAYALMDRSEVSVVEDGSVQGVREALEALLKAKPYLKGQAAAPGKSGAEFKGGDTPPADDKIRRAMGLPTSGG